MSVGASVRWRWKWLRRELRIAATMRGGDRLAVLGRLGRRPPSNARWRLQRFGRRTLTAILETARELDVPVFITFGTLLGWIREQGFIPHDDDIDLGLLDEHWKHVRPLAERLATQGWEVRWFGREEVRFRNPSLGGVAVDIFRFRHTLDGVESRAFSSAGEHIYRFPARLFAPLREVHAFGAALRTPAHPKEFLAAHYGDWQVPKETWDYRTDADSARPPADD